MLLTLPQEIVTNILDYLPFSDKFRPSDHDEAGISCICKALRRASFDSKVLIIPSTPTVHLIGVHDVLSRFPLAETIHILDGPFVHDIAASFSGHRAVRVLHCRSANIFLAVLSGGCPKISKVVVPECKWPLTRGLLGNNELFHYDEEDDEGSDGFPSDSSHELETTGHEPGRTISSSSPRLFTRAQLLARRNLRSIIDRARQIPSLDTLELDRPIIRDMAGSGFGSFSNLSKDHVSTNLTTLKLSSITPAALGGLALWAEQLSAAEATTLHSLRFLNLDLDYLHVPSHALRTISGASPLLESLKLKFGILSQTALYEIADSNHHLRELNLSKCDFWFHVNPEHASTSNNMGSSSVVQDTEIRGCRTSYFDVISYLQHSIPSLTKLHFNMCTIRDLRNNAWSSSPTRKRTGTGLISLKVFDVGKYRPSVEDVVQLVKRNPNLKSLRMDAEYSLIAKFDPQVENACCVEHHSPFADLIVSGHLSKIRLLEFRCSRIWKGSDAPFPSIKEKTSCVEKMAIMALPNLESLSIWSTPIFPENLLRDNAKGLKYLAINYPTHPSTLTKFDSRDQWPASLPSFPNLRKLEIRGITELAHAHCIALLKALVLDGQHGRTKNLQELVVEALYRASGAMPFDLAWQPLVDATPRLVSLKLTNWSFPMEAFQYLSGCAVVDNRAPAVRWPHLNSLVCTGDPTPSTRLKRFAKDEDTEGIGHGMPFVPLFGNPISREFESAHLQPLFHTHRCLSSFRVTVAGLSLPGFGPLTMSGSAVQYGSIVETRLDDDGLVSASGSLSGNRDSTMSDRELLGIIQRKNASMYRAYSESISSRWWWVADVSVRSAHG
ncbi:hypothetical protein BJ742DRAFT_848945 [Cladochytrium replicatum]|nr:hypothetical protein BJ742DRAFT_848945 [Cladochytrium replicatum]